jgi:hypothetical protein
VTANAVYEELFDGPSPSPEVDARRASPPPQRRARARVARRPQTSSSGAAVLAELLFRSRAGSIPAVARSASA